MTASSVLNRCADGARLLLPAGGLRVRGCFFFGPLAMFLAQVGMGHIAIIDACDLSLTIQGEPVSKRIQALKSRLLPILTAGIIAGMLSMILSTTIIGWLFWLPAVYVGCTLWTIRWPKS